MILPLPAHIVDLLRKKRAPLPVKEGGRNTSLASHLGGLRRRGASDEELLLAAHEFNQTCDPPLEESELLGVARSIAKYPPAVERAEDVMRELNSSFAVVQVGTKVRVLQERADDFLLLPPAEFKTLFSNRRVASGRSQRTVGEHWLQDPQRRQYRGIDFDPSCGTPEGIYNIFRGWGVTASSTGSCQRFLNHIHTNICAGDDLLYHWVIGWFAQIFQQPTVKLGTSLVLRGAQGTGKTLVGKVFGTLFGAAYRHVASGRMVTGQFNHHLEGCILLHADEAFWAGDKASEGVLKDLVTNDTQWIERKGIEAVLTKNYLRLLVTSNSDWVVPAGMEERRFATLDVGAAHMQDAEYFRLMMDELANGGYEALLHHCLHLDLTRVNLRVIPQTMALHEQKLASLKPEDAWFIELLQGGVLPGDETGSGLVATAALFGSYYAHAQKVGVRHRSIATIVGIFLKKTVPGLRRTTLHDADGRPSVYYHFPSLADCRAAYSKALGGYDGWGEPLTWQRAPEHQQEGEPDDNY